MYTIARHHNIQLLRSLIVYIYTVKPESVFIYFFTVSHEIAGYIRNVSHLNFQLLRIFPLSVYYRRRLFIIVMSTVFSVPRTISRTPPCHHRDVLFCTFYAGVHCDAEREHLGIITCPRNRCTVPALDLAKR